MTTRYRHTATKVLLLLLLMAGVQGAWASTTVRKDYKAATSVTNVTKSGTAEYALPMVKITYGSGTWNSYAYTYDTSHGINYGYDFQVNSGAPRNGASTVTFSLTEQPAIPDNGSYVVLEPLVNGTMMLDYYVNDSPSEGTEYCLLRVDGSTIEDYRFIPKDGTATKGRTLTFAAEADKKYYFFANGTTVKFMGFSFQYEQERVWDVAQIITDNSIEDKTLNSSFPISGTGTYYCPDNTGVSLNKGDSYLGGLAFHTTDSWRINTTTSPTNSIQNIKQNAGRMFGVSGAGKGMKLIVQASTDLTTTSANWSNHFNDALGFVTNGSYYVGTIPTLSSTDVAFAVNPNGGVGYVELVSALPHFSPAYVSYTLGDANGFVQPVLYDASGNVVANSDVTYTSSNTSVVTVSADGHSYTPVSVGTATITATVGGTTVSLEVNVSSPALAWTSTKAVTVSLLDADNNNHIDALIPTLYNATGHSITYTPNTQGDNAAWFVATASWETDWGKTNTTPRIRKPGTVTLTATDATDGTVNTSFSLTVTDPGLTTGRYHANDNSYEFPNTGRLAAGATITSVAGVTMQYGVTGDLPVVVNAGGKTVVKIIDGNGFSHPNLSSNIPVGGTFYKFVATEAGTLIINGVFDTPKMYDGSGTEVTLTADGSDYKASLTRGTTYYLYNKTSSNGASNIPMLHSFKYESQVDVEVGSSQWKFRNNTFADEIGDTGDGSWTYSSSNTDVVSFDNDTYGDATKTGVATIKAAGYATVTASKNITSHTYVVKVKQDSWTDFSVSTEGISMSGTVDTDYVIGDYNSGKAIHPKTVPFSMTVPAIAGQTFQFVAGKTGSGSYNHDINLSNTTTGSFRVNNQNTDNTWTTTVTSGAYNVELSISDEKATNGTYIKSVQTYFPTNTIVFGSATYTVSYLTGYEQTGQLATTANSTYNVLYVSSDATKVAVHPFTGRVTVKEGAASQSVTITAYNLGEVGKYNGNSTAATYTLNVGAAEAFTMTVNVEDLMYMPGRVATGGGLNRQIPYLDITVSGDDAAISSGTSALKLLHKGSNNGTLTITPRYTGSTKLTMNSLTLTFSEAPKAGDKLTVNGTEKELTAATTQTFSGFTTGEAITVSYASIGNGVSIKSFQVGGTAASGTAADLLTATKAAPTLTYSPSSYNVAVGNTVDAVMPATNSNFKNLRGITYELTSNTGSHFSLSADKLTALTASGSDGAAVLTASFVATYLFGAATSVTCSFTAVASSSVPAVTVSNALTTYSTDEIDAFVFANEKVTLTPTISGGAVPSGYTVSYTLSDESMAVVNGDNTITTQGTPGTLTVRANFLPQSGSSSPVLSATTTLYVLSGEWDFSSITNTVTNTMQSAPPGWTDDPWSKGASSNGSNRDTKDYQPILMDDGDPLPQSIALQTAYSVRMFNSGAIHLYGHNHTAYASENGNVGGVLRVPVRQGMTVTITAYNTTGEGEEIELRGLNNLENTEAASTFLVNTLSTTESFIANNDNYIEIVNSTANVNLFITAINVSNKILFQYGTETYVKAGSGTFVNPVLNAGTSTLDYTYRNVVNTVASGINATTGDVTYGAGYGIFEVVAAATGGLLDGQSSSYQATVIGFNVTNGSGSVSSSSTTVDVKDRLTIETGNTFGEDNSTAAVAEETAIKNKVQFSIVSATNTASLVGTSLTMEGAGVVTLRATLGAISETFTYTLTGASLNVANAVISREKIWDAVNNKYKYEYPSSYTITLNTASGVSKSTSTPYSSTYWFDVQKMKDNIMGTLKSKGMVSKLTFTESEQTLVISGFNDGDITDDITVGGVIPIYASYVYNSTTYYIEGTLTVAYAKHTWTFTHNLISGDNSAEGVVENIHTGLAKWYSAYTNESTNTREGKWTSTATYDMPTDEGDAIFATGTADDNHTNSHLSSHDWKFVRKMKDAHRESAIIYYYNHDVNGQNALVIPETQGLVMTSNKNNQQLGVEMSSERVTRSGDNYSAGWGKPLFYTRTGTSGTDPGYTYTQVTGSDNEVFDSSGELVSSGSNFLGNGTQMYYASNIMLLNGGTITLPGLQKGQWVEVRWTRHQDDLGERILMTNLSDAAGTEITSTYKIGNCFYNLEWSTSTYMFQATEDGDVTFEVADNIYVSIQEIILHEPTWTFTSSISARLKGYDDTKKDGSDKKYVDYTEGEKAAWTNATAPDVDWIYLWNDDAAGHTMTFLERQYQNAPNAPQTWKFEIDEMLKREGAVMTTTGVDNGEATLTYNGGWGKVKITMTSYTQNLKYVANQKTWTITFGQAPKQTYPYTWDFTKFFSSTLGSTTNDITWGAVGYSEGNNTLLVATYNNYSGTDYSLDGHSNSYNTDDYQSYYVEGGQLVSYGLRNTNNGVLRETAGLGFKLDADGDANHQPDQNMLLLNMTNNVAVAQQATNKQTWATVTDGGHQTESHLTIGSGGIVIVPKPNDASNYGDYYIYIKSSTEPSYNTSVKKMVAASAGTNEEVDDNYDVPTGVYKYRFSANANAEFTFTSAGATDSQLHNYETPADRSYTDIYAIAVTKEFKSVKKLNGVGWATESRDYAVDYTLDSLLTNRPLQAYSVIARSSNPIYSENKAKTTVRLQDRNYVVPANQGLVLKQETGSPGSNSSTYTVPLFVPAVTTATDNDYAFTNNLMRPNVTETIFSSETETIDETDETEYTRFIFSERYMTWKKEGSTTTTTDFITGTLPGFYRLHLYENGKTYGSTTLDAENDTNNATAYNTLGANKAYLVLLTNRINDPIWQATAGEAKQLFIGIEGVSDVEEVQTATGKNHGDGRTYNMKGQAMNNEGRLPAGIYIRNGKKIIIK